MIRGVKRHKGAGKQSKKQSYEAQAAKYKQELQEQELQKHILEGKVIAIEKFESLVSLIQSGNMQRLMESLMVTEQQAVSIINMKISDFLPRNKTEIQKNMEEVEKEIQRLTQLSSDYEACLRVMQLEEQQTVLKDQVDRNYMEMYNLGAGDEEEDEEYEETGERRKKKSKRKQRREVIADDDFEIQIHTCPLNNIDCNHTSTKSTLEFGDEEQPCISDQVPLHQVQSPPRHGQQVLSPQHTRVQNDQNADCLAVGYMEGKIQRLEYSLFLECVEKKSEKMGKLDQYVAAAKNENVLLFTSSGHAYSIKPKNIPDNGASPKQLLGTCTALHIAGMIPSNNISQGERLILLTKFGQVKCSRLHTFSKSKGGGQIAMGLYSEDEVVNVVRCHPLGAIMVGTAGGRVICLRSEDIPEGGKVSKGMKAAKLRGVDYAVGMLAVDPQVLTLIPKSKSSAGGSNEIQPDDNEDVEIVGPNNAGPWLLIITQRGLCKRVPINRFRVQHSTAFGISSTPIRKLDQLHTIMFVPSNCIEMQLLVCTQQTYSHVLIISQVPIKSRQANGQNMIPMDSDDRVRQVMELPSIKKENGAQKE